MTIKGYFGEISAANDAVKKLQESGFKGAFVDINDHYIGNKNVSTNNPGTSSAPSLSQLVLNSGSNYRDESNSPLAAASPMVGGMSSFDEISDINYVVSVDADNNSTDEVREILKSMGGYLGDPNVSGEKVISSAEVDLTKAVSKLNDDIK